MPKRLPLDAEKKVPRPFAVEKTLYDEFCTACANTVIGKKSDGSIQGSNASREIRLFMIDFLKKYNKRMTNEKNSK